MRLFTRIATPITVAALTAASLMSVAAITNEGIEYGPYFGDGNVPEACENEMPKTLADGSENPDYWYIQSAYGEGGLTGGPATVTPPNAVCNHMAGDMNSLDDPEVDVLIVVPASPAVERDLRITRQSLEMWDGGVDVVAEALGMQWLADGFNINVSVGGVEYLDAALNPSSFYDPEIVVIVSNPVGGIGIGVDPLDLFGFQSPCLPVADPLSYDEWASVPGFDAHHGERFGTYMMSDSRCGDNLGGSTCFAVNGAIDPTPGPAQDTFSLYDLVSHEVGHCLTIGHVGDGAEGAWAKTAIEDIMAYDTAPVRINKCVSTLDVHGIAHVMARYLDVDGDGEAGTAADQALVAANDPVTEDGRPFFVQREEDQFFASTSGRAYQCPQPDLGAIPGERTDFRPEVEWTPMDAEGRDIATERFRWEMGLPPA